MTVSQRREERSSRTEQNFKDPSSRWVVTMRTSSQRLAAVRKSEAMLLASVNCSSLCLNLGSYLPKREGSHSFHIITSTDNFLSGS